MAMESMMVPKLSGRDMQTQMGYLQIHRFRMCGTGLMIPMGMG